MVTRRLVRPIYHLVSALATYTAKFEVCVRSCVVCGY